MRTTAYCAAMCCAIAATGVARGQADDADVRQELGRLRERMETLEQRHDEDQSRIRDLEQRLDGAPCEGEDAWLTEQRAAAIRRISESVVAETDRRAADPAGGAAGWGQSNLLNPQIAVVLDMGASISSNEDNKAYNRFNLREAELDLRGAITPYADGLLVLAVGEEIEDTDEGIDVATVLELEEGYINFHTLPYDLQVKGGKFRTAFGRSNRLHTHDLPQITRPLAVQAFFGPEGLATVGVSTSWLVPNPWDRYLELTAEVVNSDGGEESPILGGPNADNPAVVAHLKWFEDVGETGSLELGGSYLYGHTSDMHAFDANVWGLDATYKWLDPEAPDTRSLVLQTELFWASNDVVGDGSDPFRNDSFGMYAFVQYQFDRNWYAGVRVDYTEYPLSEAFGPDDSAWAVSPYVSYYLSEFLRLRLEYQHHEFEMGGRWDDEDNLLFGLSFVLGAHPPHPYWVNR